MKYSLPIVFLLLFVGCTKDVQELSTLQVYGITSKKAVVDWSGVFPNEQDHRYQVYLEGQMVAELDHTFFYELKWLASQTTYHGKVVAKGTKGGDSHTEAFSFVTKENKKPHEFTLELEYIRGESASIFWEKPFDPDGDTITYIMQVNGVILVDTITETNYTVSGLNPETTCNLVVYAQDGYGNEQPAHLTFKTTAAGAKISNEKEKIDGVNREYGLYLPAGTGTEARPLFIHLHGWGGVVWPEMASDYFLTLAENEQFIGLMPQARSDQYGNIAWQDPSDVEFLRRLIDTVTVRHKVDVERIYLSGHSNGGFMTYILAKSLEYKLAAIGPIAGTHTYQNYYNYSLQKPMPLCHIHGTADSTVQVQGNPTHVSFDQVLDFFIPNNNADPNPTVLELPDIYPYDNSTVTKITYHTQSNSSGDIVYYRINNGNHSIPGTRSWANHDIHAWDVLWEFFEPRNLSDK